MQSLNITKLTSEQWEWLSHKLPKYTTVNCDSLRRHIQQIDENYPYSMPTWLIILITALGTLMLSAGITIFLHCKHTL